MWAHVGGAGVTRTEGDESFRDHVLSRKSRGGKFQFLGGETPKFFDFGWMDQRNDFCFMVLPHFLSKRTKLSKNEQTTAEWKGEQMAVLPATMASVDPRLRLHQNQPRNINISHKNLSIFPHPSAEPEGYPAELRGSLLDLKGPTHDVLVSQNLTHNSHSNQRNTKNPAADQLHPTTLPTIPFCTVLIH